MAVDAVLASTLWAAEQRRTVVGKDAAKSALQPPQKLATACVALDTALHGGLEYGQIHCISAEADSASKEVCHALLTSHLSTGSSAQATVIDTTNSFDVKRLHSIIVASLRRSEKGGDHASAALEALGRVRVMKAFDFIGLTESISELRDSLEAAISEQQRPMPSIAAQAPMGTIRDSDEEDDMLNVPGPDTAAAPNALPLIETGAVSDLKLHGDYLVIIDNIAHAAGPLLKSNHSQGQALLSSFMRSLFHLTRTHNIATLLINSATTYPNATATDCPSIFASCLLRPALGRSFAYLVDTHMLLHRLPLTSEDAKAAYGTQVGGTGQRQVSKRSTHYLRSTVTPHLLRPFGRKLAYAHYGSRTGPTLFFLHGFPGSRLQAAIYHPTAQHLGIRLVALDRPGIGQSSLHPGRTLVDHAEDVRCLANHLELETYGVIGVSGGGPYALASAKALAGRGLESVTVVAGMGPLGIGTTGMNVVNRVLFWALQYCPNAVRWLQTRVSAALAKLTDEQLARAITLQFTRHPLRWPKPHPQDAALFANNPALIDLLVQDSRQANAQGVHGFVDDGRLLVSDWGFRVEEIETEKVQVKLWYGSLDSNVPVRIGEEVAVRMKGRVEWRVEERTHLGLFVGCAEEILRDAVKGLM
nr:hypothetical protein B0A51_18089 [Rachicladosporium sp. CCFEE 5018]